MVVHLQKVYIEWSYTQNYAPATLTEIATISQRYNSNFVPLILGLYIYITLYILSLLLYIIILPTTHSSLLSFVFFHSLAIFVFAQLFWPLSLPNSYFFFCVFSTLLNFLNLLSLPNFSIFYLRLNISIFCLWSTLSIIFLCSTLSKFSLWSILSSFVFAELSQPSVFAQLNQSFVFSQPSPYLCLLNYFDLCLCSTIIFFTFALLSQSFIFA